MNTSHHRPPSFCVAAALVIAVNAACVTTRMVDDSSPDPRDDLPNTAQAPPRALDATVPSAIVVTASPVTVLELSPRDPIINVRVVFTAGSADDAPGKEGTAALTARLMRQATRTLNAAELARTLYPWAAELDVQVDKDTIVFLGRVHGDHADAWADVLLDIILNPRLAMEDLNRVRAEQLALLQNTLRAGDDEALQREALESMLYGSGSHPYGHTPVGTVKGLQAVTLEDIQAFRQMHLTRDRVVLGVSGGASPAFVEKLTTALRRLPPSSGTTDVEPRRTVEAPPPPVRNMALLIEKPAAGTAISIGFALPDLKRSHPDYVAMKLAETWFGEHRNMIGHLFASMRERRGLNYGDYAYVEHFRQDGWGTYELLNIPRRTQYFSMWIRPVQHGNRLFALRQAVWELDNFVRKGIPDDGSFERVQAFVQGYWQAKEQEPMRRLGYRMDRALTGALHDRDGLRAAAAKLTREEVNAAVRRHLRAERLSIVVVTENSSALRDDIVTRKSAPITYAAAVPDAQREEDAAIDAFPLALEADAIRVLPAAALFEE